VKSTWPFYFARQRVRVSTTAHRPRNYDHACCSRVRRPAATQASALHLHPRPRPSSGSRRRRSRVSRYRNPSAVGHQSRVLVLTDEASGTPDEELLRLVVQGDREAFIALYRRYEGFVHRFAYQMSGSEAVAEDITQETFLTLTRSAARYNAGLAKFSTYLYGIVRHLTRRRLWRDRMFVALPAGLTDRWKAREPSAEQALVEAASRQQTIERVRRAVLSLPPRYREVIVLCDLHGRGYADAAAIVGCAVGTVRSRLHRGRDLLRKKLELADESASIHRYGRDVNSD
jgi:RNA polymerase sigma-70 factor (ECF subfamily)